MRIGRRINNFGDLIGPVLVERIASAERLGTSTGRLLTVGSIMHFAREGDVVWGSGINGKVARHEHVFRCLDVRAVRGPVTRARLAEMGIDAPDVYGDPALLVPDLFPDLPRGSMEPSSDYVLIPNLHDVPRFAGHPNFMSPREDWVTVAERIRSSRFVVGSSLHGLILADAYGVPAVRLRSISEPPFKYDDYAAGVSRPAALEAFDDVGTAVRHGMDLAKDPQDMLVNWDRRRLLAAFPRDLWDADDA